MAVYLYGIYAKAVTLGGIGITKLIFLLNIVIVTALFVYVVANRFYNYETK